MTTEEFLHYMNSGKQVTAEDDIHQTMHRLSQEAIRITMELNTRYHTPDEINALMSELIGKPVEVGLFPPFYTNTVLATLNHGILPEERHDLIPKPIRIGKNVWIGSNSTILPGVSIGDNAVIGAGSVVTKDIPENMMAVGHPARVIKSIYD